MWEFCEYLESESLWFFRNTLQKEAAMNLLEFLSNLESATSLLDIRKCYVWGWSQKSDASVRDSLIFSAT